VDVADTPKFFFPPRGALVIVGAVGKETLIMESNEKKSYTEPTLDKRDELADVTESGPPISGPVPS